jgi:hypothetical protein
MSRASAVPTRNILSLLFTLGLLILGVLSLARTYSYYGRLLAGWDAQFYYAQARSLFVDGDLDLTNDLEQTPYRSPFETNGSGILDRPLRNRPGKIISKYPIGLSLAELPWLLTGYSLRRFWESISSYHLSAPLGYSTIEITTVAVGLLVYTVIGLYLLNILIRIELGTSWSEFSVAATWLGTSLFFYSAIFPFMAHCVAFTLVVAILLCFACIHRKKGNRTYNLCLIPILSALLFVTRPQEALFLLLLVPYAYRLLVRDGIQSQEWPLGLSSLVGIAIALLLPIHNYVQTGLFTINGYTATGEKGFDWLRPDVWMVLLSPIRGLFWMNPIILLALVGYAILYTKEPTGISLPWIIFAHGVVQIYTIASWSSPGQGDAFGSRMWIEATPIVAIGLSYLLQNCNRWAAAIVVGLSSISIMWTFFLLGLYVKGKLGPPASYSSILNQLLPGLGWLNNEL